VIEYPPAGRKLPLGARATLIRLRDGGLAIHSPGPLAGNLKAEIEKLGKPAALIAPNTMHHSFLAENQAAFPDAKTFVAPGLPDKVKTTRFDEILGDKPAALLQADLKHVVVRGTPKLNEVVFLHPASRTLILCDLAFNIRKGNLLLRTIMRLNGGFDRFGPTRYMRSMIKDKATFHAGIQEILAWDFDRIALPHGDLVDANGKEQFREAFAWA
jgi:hypothetical protein